MKALVYHSPGIKAWEEKPKPVILEPSDAVIVDVLCADKTGTLKQNMLTGSHRCSPNISSISWMSCKNAAISSV